MEPHAGTQAKKGIGKKLFVIIFLVLILVAVLIVGIFALVLGGLYFGSKSTEEFNCAMSEIKKNEQAIKILGTSIEDGYLILPNINISGPKRQVSFSVPVSGSKSGGTLSVNSYRDGFRSDFMMSLNAGSQDVRLYKGSYPCGKKE